MAPRKRTTTTTEEIQDDILDKATETDLQETAGDLADVLADLRGLSGSDVQVLVYKIPKGGPRGGWEYVMTITPPIDTSELMDGLRNDWGAGDYALRVRAAGKIKSTKFISIAASKSAPAITPSKNDNNELLQILLAQNAASKSDMMQMTTLMMQSQQASQQQMMQLMTVLLPAMMGGKEKTSELLTAFATLQNMGDKGGGMKEAIETLVAAKSLFGGGESGGSNLDLDDNMIGNALKIAGPLLGGLAKTVSERGQQQQVTVLPPVQPHVPPQPVPVMLPNGGEVAIPDQVSRFPVLDLIKDDVLFLFNRQHDPELSAEVVIETLEKHQVEEAAISDVIAAFAVSPNWIEELASEGIDLRSNPVWANQFLSALVSLYTAPSGDDDDTGGGTGGAKDNVHHGATVPAGVATDAGEKQSGGVDAEP